MDDGRAARISIPVYRPDLSGNELRYVAECIESTWISSKGRFVGEFEGRFAQRTGCLHATSVSNGTVALHLALLALGLGPGDEVIVPTLTYIAPVNAVSYTGATPVFADSVADTWQIDPVDVARRITPRTKAIIAVHLYGHPCDMAALTGIATAHRIFLIEDCAETIGAEFRARPVGSFGDVAAFSFFGNKTITTGEGGMLVTNDRTIYERAKHLKGQGLADHREYWHDVVGYNYRMTNICAALGVAQMERIDEFLARKRRIAERYRSALSGLPLTLQAERPEVRHGWWMTSILVDRQADRDPLRRFLAAQGIETRPVFFPVHTMPMYTQRYQRHPVAEDIAWRGINLPSWPGLEDSAIDFICAAVRDWYQRRESVDRPVPDGIA